MTRLPMLIGLPHDDLVAHAEARLGPLDALGMTVLIPERPVRAVTQAQAWLGEWARAHPQTAHPWRREQARMQWAAAARRQDAMARPRPPQRSVAQIEALLAETVRRCR